MDVEMENGSTAQYRVLEIQRVSYFNPAYVKIFFFSAIIATPFLYLLIILTYPVPL